MICCKFLCSFALPAPLPLPVVPLDCSWLFSDWYTLDLTAGLTGEFDPIVTVLFRIEEFRLGVCMLTFFDSLKNMSFTLKADTVYPGSSRETLRTGDLVSSCGTGWFSPN